MYQRVEVIGYLGNDPQMHYAPDGTPVTSFSVATSKKWLAADGQKKESTVWFRVAAWRKLAEICNQFLKKGALVFVSGEMAEPKPYQDKQGNWRASLDMTADEIKFLSGKSQATETEDIPF